MRVKSAWGCLLLVNAKHQFRRKRRHHIIFLIGAYRVNRLLKRLADPSVLCAYSAVERERYFFIGARGHTDRVFRGDPAGDELNTARQASRKALAVHNDAQRALYAHIAVPAYDHRRLTAVDTGVFAGFYDIYPFEMSVRSTFTNYNTNHIHRPF